MVRIGGIDSSIIAPIVGAAHSEGYRNKAQLPVTVNKDGKICVGFFAPRSHRVIPLESCHLQIPVFNEAIRVFVDWANRFQVSVYDETTHTGILRHLYLRYAEKTGQLMVCIVANTQELRKSKQLVEMLRTELACLTTVGLNVNTEKTNVITGRQCHTLYGIPHCLFIRSTAHRQKRCIR